MSPTTVYFDMIIHEGFELDGGKVKFGGLLKAENLPFYWQLIPPSSNRGT
jgi:hypothetical protein